MLLKISNTSLMSNKTMEKTGCCRWAQQQFIQTPMEMEFHNYVNKVIALDRPKRYNGVCLRKRTTSKTTLRTSLVLIWFDDSPYSNQSFDKTIDPTTDHEDQSMKISSFFNIHARYPLKWTKSDKLLSSNSPSCCLAWPTSSGVSNTDSWRREWFIRKPTWSRAQHNW